MAVSVVPQKGVLIRRACQVLRISETCSRDQPTRVPENTAIAHWLEWRGTPQVIRAENGPEYLSAQFQAWAQHRGIALHFIQPGQPQQKAYVERFNCSVRLNEHLFASMTHAQDTATHWLWQYNVGRPHMALGGLTPYQKLADAA